MNAKLLTAEDFGKRRIHVCELALKRLDAKGQAEIDKLHLESGWSTNQILSQYDLPSVEGGDEPMASANLMTLKALMAKGAEAQIGGRPAKPEPQLTDNNGGEGAEEGGE